jgi:hypothetical protein
MMPRRPARIDNPTDSTEQLFPYLAAEPIRRTPPTTPEPPPQRPAQQRLAAFLHERQPPRTQRFHRGRVHVQNQGAQAAIGHHQ